MAPSRITGARGRGKWCGKKEGRERERGGGGRREDVETKKGKNIVVDVVGGGTAIIPTTLFSLSQLRLPSTPHPWERERERDPRAGSPLPLSYEELMRSSGGANSKCRRSTFTATAERREGLVLGGVVHPSAAFTPSLPVTVCGHGHDDVEYPFIWAVKRPLRGRPTPTRSLARSSLAVLTATPL